MASTNTYQHSPLNNGKALTQDWSETSVLELVLMRVRLRAQRRTAWLSELWGDYSSDTNHLENSYLQACLEDRDTAKAEAAWYQEAEQIQPINQKLQRIERSLTSKAGSRLQQLRQMFRLSERELDLLQTCLALALSPTLGAVYAHLQLNSARSYATETLAAQLFGYEYRSLWQPSSPLAVWKLVQVTESASGEPEPLEIAPMVIDWLQGELRVDEVLIERVHSVPLLSPLASWPVEETARTIERLLQQESAVRVQLIGFPGSGRRTFAAAVANCFGIETLSVDTSELEDRDWPELFVRVQRLAVMGGLALVWYGTGLHHSWPDHIAPAPLQFVACDRDQPAVRLVPSN